MKESDANALKGDSHPALSYAVALIWPANSMPAWQRESRLNGNTRSGENRFLVDDELTGSNFCKQAFAQGCAVSSPLQPVNE